VNAPPPPDPQDRHEEPGTEARPDWPPISPLGAPDGPGTVLGARRALANALRGRQ
jgi:hypothetical protein